MNGSGNARRTLQIWLGPNGGRADWLQRVSIASWAQSVAAKRNVKLPVVLGVESVDVMFS
jgi:hypothetical protein